MNEPVKQEKAESQRDALMREINKKLLPELATLRKRVEELEVIK